MLPSQTQFGINWKNLGLCPVMECNEESGRIMSSSDQALSLDMAQLVQDACIPSLYDPTLLQPTNVCSQSIPVPRRNNQLDFDSSSLADLDLQDLAMDSSLSLTLGSCGLECDDSFGSDGLDIVGEDGVLSTSIWNSAVDTASDLKSDIGLLKKDSNPEPTLAELNGNNESLLDNLDFDLPLLEEKSGSIFMKEYESSKPIQWDMERLNAPPMLHSTMPATSTTTISNSADYLSTSYPSGIHNLYSDSGFQNRSNSLWSTQQLYKFNSTATGYANPRMDNSSIAIKQEIPDNDAESPAYGNSRMDNDSCSAAATVKEERTDNELVTPPVAIEKMSTLHELLMQNRHSNIDEVSKMGSFISGRTIATAPSVFAVSVVPTEALVRLSASAPSHCSEFERLWKASLTPVDHHSSSAVEDLQNKSAESALSVSTSTGEAVNPKDEPDSHDEGFDSDAEDSDHYEELSSEAESNASDDLDGIKPRSQSPISPSAKAGDGSSKRERFFWQYNVQAKGPKINRLSLDPRTVDPHCLNEITDPVFSPNCVQHGIKHKTTKFYQHSGKARRGDGNDLTPNPRKLYHIGHELKKLNKVINVLTPVSELPFNARPKSRKEKNKLASRACRLKKKAQHEANKLKLYGLEQEHRKLMYALLKSREMIANHIQQEKEDNDQTDDLSQKLEKIMKSGIKTKVAGNTSDFVNHILDKIAEGKPANLDEL